MLFFFFFQAEDGIRDRNVTGVQTCALPISDAFTVDDPRFTTGRVVGPSMLTLDGDEHGRHRDPFARPFRLESVRERFTSLVAAETDHLVDGIEDRKSTV